MATWFYQLNQQAWSPNKYRLDVWEGEPWRWPVGNIFGGGRPQPGDKIIFFYAPAGGNEAGFYGWAIVLRFEPEFEGEKEKLYFRPVAPSDYLKMDPWWGENVKAIVDRIRGKVAMGTLWPVPDEIDLEIRNGIAAWLSRKEGSKS